ncbi:MAG: TonB family protein [Campylobacterales bacterium]|nr:TonB family protein [Campylobacterales bacterium]
MANAMYRVAQGNAESKALLLSFVLHASVIGFYLLFMYQKPSYMMPSKAIVLEISSIERVAPTPPIPTPPKPEPVVPQEVIKPMEPVKAIEPVKPIEKVKPKPKPMLKPKPIAEPKAFQEKAVEEAIPPPMTSLASEPVVAAVPSTATTPTTPSSTNSAEPYERTDFEIIRDKVLSRLIYPSVARRMGWNGVVQVELVIDTTGKLISATIYKSSNRSVLDEAALSAALKLQGQQLPKPKSLSTIILPIAFKLR